MSELNVKNCQHNRRLSQLPAASCPTAKRAAKYVARPLSPAALPLCWVPNIIFLLRPTKAFALSGIAGVDRRADRPTCFFAFSLFLGWLFFAFCVLRCSNDYAICRHHVSGGKGKKGISNMILFFSFTSFFFFLFHFTLCLQTAAPFHRCWCM